MNEEIRRAARIVERRLRWYHVVPSDPAPAHTVDKFPDWDRTWQGVDFTTLAPLNTGLFSSLLDAAIPRETDGSRSAIEIGCFPGRFIEYVGQKGYVISGIDSYPRVGEIAAWARARGRSVGSFSQATLEQYAGAPAERFDVVFSMGFIEHFGDFCGVLYDHLSLCKVGGRVLIGAPNFASPLQRALHQVLDDKNLSGHVLEAMYPSVWAVFLTALGVNVEYAGPVGGFSFWSETETDHPQVRVLQALIPQLTGVAQQLSPRFNRVETSYLGVFGTKAGELPEKKAVAALSDRCREIALNLSSRDQLLAKARMEFVSELCL